MASASFLFHANLLYAEYPFERIPEIVEQSYIPVLQTQPSPLHRCYCKAGTWSTEKIFALWSRDPDNEVLDRFALDAYNAFTEKEASLTAEARDELLKDLLLSFNSDGRGWTPLSERRLFCYNKAKKVLKALT